MMLPAGPIYVVSFFSFVMLFGSAGCSSGMVSYQSPVVKKAGDYQASVLYTNTESLEAQGTIGLGYNADVTLKLSPMNILPSMWNGKNMVPYDLDLKVQLKDTPCDIAAGAGGSHLIFTGGDWNRRTFHSTYHSASMGRIFLLAGTENVFCGYQLNYVSNDTPVLHFGRDYSFDIPANRIVGSYILGFSIGKSIKLKSQIHLIPSRNGLQKLWGAGLEYSVESHN